MKKLPADRLLIRALRIHSRVEANSQAGTFGFMSQDSMRLLQNGPTQRSNLRDS